MKHKRLAKLVRNRPEKYPYELERHYERVLDRIMQVWGSPGAEQCFLDLLVDGRGSRSGFPVKVAEEIYFLSELHSLTFNSKGEARIGSEMQRLSRADLRTAEFRTVLEERGFKFVPTEMFACISKGDLANVVMFVNAGMSVDTLNDRGWTPLMVALFEGQEKVALFLIKRGADPFFCDATGYRPIHWAAFHGYVTVIRELAQRGANLGVKTNFGWPPLLQAAARGYAVAVDTLVELGANVDICDNEGWTALHKAAANGHEDVVAVLLLHGAQRDQSHTDGKTRVHIAIEVGQRVIAATLLKAGANANALDKRGLTPLHVAAERNDVALIDLLLASGARCSARDQLGLTPLLRAVEFGAIAAIRRLLAAGARIDETLDARPEEKAVDPARPGRVGSVISSATRVAKGIRIGRRHRLHEYVANNDFRGVRTEVGKGVDPNAIGPDGLTPLEVAAAHGHRQMWGVLIDLGAGRRSAKA
jgi:ankyrin repeat protein